jgi:hypothetical protein
MTEVGERVLWIACGGLASELVALRRRAGWDHVTVTCLPAKLHTRPGAIPEAVRAVLERERGRYARTFVVYGDCGTGGALDRLLDDYAAERLPVAHCYELFAGAADFAALQAEEPGTFYLTDFLVRHFDRLVIASLGLDRHPELRSSYFGNYHRVVYLRQRGDSQLVGRARACAAQLGLRFEMRSTGLAPLETALSESRRPREHAN